MLRWKKKLTKSSKNYFDDSLKLPMTEARIYMRPVNQYCIGDSRWLLRNCVCFSWAVSMCAWVSMGRWVKVPMEAERRPSDTLQLDSAGGCELLNMSTRKAVTSLQEHQVLLTTEPSLPPCDFYFFFSEEKYHSKPNSDQTTSPLGKAYTLWKYLANRIGGSGCNTTVNYMFGYAQGPRLECQFHIVIIRKYIGQW